MEDEIIIEASLPSPLQSWSMAAVLDGHGGDLGMISNLENWYVIREIIKIIKSRENGEKSFARFDKESFCW